MIEIEFRAKKNDGNGEWVYGHYFYNKVASVHNISNGEIAYPIIYETLSQYRNKKDKNGTKIYNGDIVRQWFNDIEWDLLLVEPEDDLPDNDVWTGSHNERDIHGKMTYEVIGNIFDDPGLIRCDADVPISVRQIKRTLVIKVLEEAGVKTNKSTVDNLINVIERPYKHRKNLINKMKNEDDAEKHRIAMMSMRTRGKPIANPESLK